MPWGSGRKLAAALCAAFLVAGCGALLGIHDIDVPPDADAANPSDTASEDDLDAHVDGASADVGSDSPRDTSGDASVDSAADASGDAGADSAFDGASEGGADSAADTFTGPPDAASCSDANLSGDPNNCGGCGRVCGTGAGCSMGLCDPVAIASGLNQPAAIAADTSGVYFTTTGPSAGSDQYATEGVFMCSPTGCGSAPMTLAIDRKTPVAMALDATNVYWLEAGDQGLVSCKKSGCSRLPTVLSSQAGVFLTSLAIGGSTLYWTDGVANLVLACPTGGCVGPSTIATLGAIEPGAISFFGGSVYWANGAVGSSGSVMSCSAAGCGTSPTTLAPASGPLAIFADSTGVYFTTSGGGTAALDHVALDGGPATSPLLTGLFYPSGVVVDGSSAYVVDSASGAVWKVAIDGVGAPVQIAHNQDGPTSIAVDATWVYWTNGGTSPTNGAVMRVLK